jgi:DNA-binding NarL/FixJ family response regulator
MSQIRILIIEDEIIIAEDIRDTLTALGYEVAGIFTNGDKAVDYLSFHSPDLVLCDINIKGTMDGIQVAEKIRSRKKIPFIFLTSLSDRSTLDRAKKALPYGYIVKPFDERDLLAGIETGLYKFGQELEQLSITREKIDLLVTDPLTDQEYSIVKAMMEGLKTEEICGKMFFSVNTLKYHVKNILSKFQAENRGEIMQKIIAGWMVAK